MADDDDVGRLAAILDHLDLDEDAISNHCEQVETAYRKGFDGTVVMLLNTFFETLVREALADDLREERERVDELSEREVASDSQVEDYLQPGNTDYATLLEEAVAHGYVEDTGREALTELWKSRTRYKKSRIHAEPADVDAVLEWYNHILQRSRYNVSFHAERGEHQTPEDRTAYIREHIEQGLLQSATVYIYGQLAADVNPEATDTDIGRPLPGMENHDYRDTENITAHRRDEKDLKGNAWMHLQDLRKQYVHNLSSYDPGDPDRPRETEVREWFAVMQDEKQREQEDGGQRQEGKA